MSSYINKKPLNYDHIMYYESEFHSDKLIIISDVETERNKRKKLQQEEIENYIKSVIDS